MPSNHLILCCSLLLPSIFPSIGVFSYKSVLQVRWPKYWSFSITPSSEYSGLISWRIYWFDLLAVQGTFKSSPVPQFKSINSSALSFLYSPTLTSIRDYWKNYSFDRWTFVGKVMSLLFNMLSRLVMSFLPRSKQLLTSWLQWPSAVILEPKKVKPLTVSIVSPFAMRWWDRLPWSSFIECWVLSQLFHSPLSLSSRGSSVPLHFLP